MAVKTFQTLYKKAANDKISQWSLSVEYYDALRPAYIKTEHGYVGGAQQVDTVAVRSGKNIGKANETSIVEQAFKQAESKWNKQVTAGYTTHPNGIAKAGTLLPMLAHHYKNRKKYMVFPCYMQPKYNGIRCISYKENNGRRVFQSRLGNYFSTLKHLNHEISFFGDLVTDGELWHPNLSLQEIGSLVKNQTPGHKVNGYTVNDLRYIVYDTIIEDMPFKSRLSVLESFFKKANALRIGEQIIFMAPTTLVLSEEASDNLYFKYLDEKFEGGMYRHPESLYGVDTRSNGLQKRKPVLSGEFEIVGGVKVETGREEGTTIIQCKTEEGAIFKVRMKGDLETKRMFELDKAIGKMLTVDFQEWTTSTENGVPLHVPFHGRGVTIRDYE